MKITAVIQARMSSKRLPGKVLMTVHGKPLLSYLLRRVERCKTIDDVIIATSSDPSDDLLETFANSELVPIYRGSLTNVADRLCQAAKSRNADALVRICGDSPLIDPLLIDQLVYLFRTSVDVDLVTNVENRTFPKGQSVEVVSVVALESKISQGLSEDEKEHATLSFYKVSDYSNILSIMRSPSLSALQLSVDDQQDLETFKTITQYIKEPYEAHDLLSIINAYNVTKNVKKN
jgi:spore coat polysaccharide biosynthesis protein SpsF (cytidylyltransferase family)